jgi:ankyrin repeat protein
MPAPKPLVGKVALVTGAAGGIGAATARRLLAAGASREGRLLGARGGSPLALALFYAQTRVAELLAEPPVPDNLRSAAALNRPLQRFIADGELTPQAAHGCDFYRPLPVFPLWERTYSRQELLDEALSWAARNEALGAMAQLVQLGADVNANPYRGTPLLWAVYGDRVAAATWLLDHGADPDLRHDFGGAQHGRGAVALHLAAQYSCLGCLRLLLARGADTTIQDAAFGATPLGWAEHVGSTDASALLRAHSAG